MSSDSYYLPLSDGLTLLRSVGLVMPQLVLGAVGYWLMTGSVRDEGESGSLVTLSL